MVIALTLRGMSKAGKVAYIRLDSLSASFFFCSSKKLIRMYLRDNICGALVQFGCYHHSIKGIRPNPVIKL